ncbi:hypothetical protein [Macrococcoides caseolyticum]|uniref:hypothetical protein n=1 Tax=Macrococcoides caseolyticum TaxID=69966 RepID=UPI001F21EB1B|nr:hypothetical protein [Macrococcus caseolyticus]MCE4957999.1 hypothetical protein [Macrococcus caseolyticus]
MDFELDQIHNILVTISQQPDKDYFGYFKDNDIIYILLEMGLIEFKFNVLLTQTQYNPVLHIEVTKKGKLFITAYINQLSNGY